MVAARSGVRHGAQAHDLPADEDGPRYAVLIEQVLGDVRRVRRRGRAVGRVGVLAEHAGGVHVEHVARDRHRLAGFGAASSRESPMPRRCRDAAERYGFSSAMPRLMSGWTSQSTRLKRAIRWRRCVLGSTQARPLPSHSPPCRTERARWCHTRGSANRFGRNGPILPRKVRRGASGGYRRGSAARGLSHPGGRQPTHRRHQRRGRLLRHPRPVSAQGCGHVPGHRGRHVRRLAAARARLRHARRR